MMKVDDEVLEQYDYSSNDYLEDVVDDYSPLIGLFLIRFSELEHELNYGIAEILHSRTHEVGYVVIGNLTTRNKIELFYKFFLRLVSVTERSKLKVKLGLIKRELEELNNFRNKLVHADWLTLNKEGSVRTKIVVDNKEGFVVFKRVKILPRTIRKKIKEIEKLTRALEEFVEVSQQF